MKKIFLFISLTCLTFINLYSNESKSTFLLDSPYSNHKIEVMLTIPSNEEFQLLLFLHGASGKGIEGISQSWFDHWSDKGYAVAAISMPGYGDSTGRKDFCGPFTLNSLNFAIDAIKKELNILDFGIIGFGQGALAGILLASQRNDISCLVSSNGGYDLRRHKESGDILMSILQEKRYDLDNNDDEELEFRSAILHISDINTPVFCLHRKGNHVVTEEEVTDFCGAMLEAGKECCLTIMDNTPDNDAQKLSYEEVLFETEDWVDNLMQSET